MSEAVNSGKPRVFLSYSRRDSEFIDELVISVESHGFEVVFDRADLFPGEPWEPRLQRLITDAETTVCVVSQHWVASDQCTKELSIAVRNGRRIVPIVIDPVNPSAMPEELARLQFVFFHGAGHSFARGVVSLVETLRTDIGWLREQTRLLDKSDEWSSQARPASLLLRGVALDNALAWLATPAPRDTHVLPAVTQFIEASRAGQDTEEKARLRDRLRFTIVALAACVFGLVGAGAVGFIVYDQLQKTDAKLQVADVSLQEANSVIDFGKIADPAPPSRGPASSGGLVKDAGDLPDVVLSEDDDVVPAPGPTTPPPPSPPAEIAQLVDRLDSADKAARLAAGQSVTNLVRGSDNSQILKALAAELDPAHFASLSPAGRVNVLYMLNTYSAWKSSPLASEITKSLAGIEARAGKGGDVILGGQATTCIAALRQQIAGTQPSGCGA